MEVNCNWTANCETVFDRVYGNLEIKIQNWK